MRFTIEYTVETTSIGDAIVGLLYPNGEPTTQTITDVRIVEVD